MNYLSPIWEEGHEAKIDKAIKKRTFAIPAA